MYIIGITFPFTKLTGRSDNAKTLKPIVIYD